MQVKTVATIPTAALTTVATDFQIEAELSESMKRIFVCRSASLSKNSRSF